MYRLKADAPLYELDDESIAVLKTAAGEETSDWVELTELSGYTAALDKEMRDKLLASAQACPFNAIVIEDDDGTVLWPEEV
jgi:hypothetical protein